MEIGAVRVEDVLEGRRVHCHVNAREGRRVRSRVDDDEEQVDLTGCLAADRSAAVAPSRPSGEATHVDVQVEGLAGFDLAPEAHAVDPPEERELARVARLEQDGDGAHLGQRFNYEHARQRRSPGEVAGEERLVPSEAPTPRGRLARLDGQQLVDEQERRPVRQYIGRRRQISQVS